MKSFFKITSLASTVIGVLLLTVACETESFDQLETESVTEAQNISNQRGNCSAPYNFQCPATGQCFLDRAQAISGGCDVDAGGGDDGDDQDVAELVAISNLVSFCDSNGVSSVQVDYEVKGRVQPSGTICYGYPGSYENCYQINFDDTGYGRDNIVITGVNENADFGVHLRAQDVVTGNTADAVHDLSVKTESCSGSVSCQPNAKECDQNKPWKYYFCGKCFETPEQAASDGCQEANDCINGGGNNINNCPSSHPIFACDKCWESREQAINGGCDNV